MTSYAWLFFCFSFLFSNKIIISEKDLFVKGLIVSYYRLRGEEITVKICKGYTRIVVVLPSIRIAVKLPRFYIWNAIRTMFWLVFKHRRWRRIWQFTFCHPEMWGTIPHFLLGGIHANWLEFVFYVKTRNPFLQPTYFSFFGLLNIQKAGKECTLELVDVWCNLQEITNMGCFPDGHAFANPANFSLEDGKLRMFDYGSVGTCEVISKYGDKMFQEFDPNFSWEKFKKLSLHIYTQIKRLS